MMRYLRTTTFILFLFLSCATVAAQGQRPWETLLEELTAQDDNDIAVTSDMYDILIDLEENPININTATRDDLGRIP
ncbi:MAG: helix-hairpin-helix domain-containing protein, partial [Prevotella sp.]|nr:helix-hairpin-helix domain-containing protein [Prevotella sp.]